MQTINTINKIIWDVPHVQAADVERLKIMRIIDSNRELNISFHAWELYEYPTLPQTDKHSWMVKSTTQLEKPRYVIIGFHTNKKNNVTKNMAAFDACALSNIKVYLNSEAYPYNNLNIDFSKKRFAKLFDMYTYFQESYHEKQPSPLFNMEQFLDICPIAVIDCSKQNEILNAGTVDFRIEFEHGATLPENTSCYCLILHDKIVKYTPLTGLVRSL